MISTKSPSVVSNRVSVSLRENNGPAGSKPAMGQYCSIHFNLLGKLNLNVYQLYEEFFLESLRLQLLQRHELQGCDPSSEWTRKELLCSRQGSRWTGYCTTVWIMHVFNCLFAILFLIFYVMTLYVLLLLVRRVQQLWGIRYPMLIRTNQWQ